MSYLKRKVTANKYAREVAALVVGLFLVVALASFAWPKKADKKIVGADLASSVYSVAVLGDIACSPTEKAQVEKTFATECKADDVLAQVVAAKPQSVLLVGDLQYDRGLTADFNASFLPSWNKTGLSGYAVPGNHEYGITAAQGYFNSLKNTSISIGDNDGGYYAAKLGDWQVIGLNSNCEYIGGCGEDSEQYKWLENELNVMEPGCSLVMWHHPVFTSGKYANDQSSRERMRAIWALLEKHDVDLVLSGHDHIYERFIGLKSDGSILASAPRQFVVGTGGRSLYIPSGTKTLGSEFVLSSYGFLSLNLAKNSYGWKFIDTEGKIRDEGRQTCN